MVFFMLMCLCVRWSQLCEERAICVLGPYTYFFVVILFNVFSFALFIYILTDLFIPNFLIHLNRRPCLGKGKIQGYWRRSRHRFRRTHSQGINFESLISRNALNIYVFGVLF